MKWEEIAIEAECEARGEGREWMYVSEGMGVGIFLRLKLMNNLVIVYFTWSGKIDCAVLNLFK